MGVDSLTSQNAVNIDAKKAAIGPQNPGKEKQSGVQRNPVIKADAVVIRPNQLAVQAEKIAPAQVRTVLEDYAHNQLPDEVGKGSGFYADKTAASASGENDPPRVEQGRTEDIIREQYPELYWRIRDITDATELKGERDEVETVYDSILRDDPLGQALEEIAQRRTPTSTPLPRRFSLYRFFDYPLPRAIQQYLLDRKDSDLDRPGAKDMLELFVVERGIADLTKLLADRQSPLGHILNNDIGAHAVVSPLLQSFEKRRIAVMKRLRQEQPEIYSLLRGAATDEILVNPDRSVTSDN